MLLIPNVNQSVGGFYGANRTHTAELLGEHDHNHGNGGFPGVGIAEDLRNAEGIVSRGLMLIRRLAALVLEERLFFV